MEYLRDFLDAPEVAGEGGIEDIGIGEIEVSFVSPVGSPGVTNNKVSGSSSRVIGFIADTGDGVTTETFFVVDMWHRNNAVTGDCIAFEAVIECDTEDEGATVDS